MKKIKAGSCKKGDLIYIKDSYFEVLEVDTYFTYSSPPFVLVKCFMSSSHDHTKPYPGGIGSRRYLSMNEEVLLLSRSIE